VGDCRGVLAEIDAAMPQVLDLVHAPRASVHHEKWDFLGQAIMSSPSRTCSLPHLSRAFSSHGACNGAHAPAEAAPTCHLKQTEKARGWCDSLE
jgi:hypothetical protein